MLKPLGANSGYAPFSKAGSSRAFEWLEKGYVDRSIFAIKAYPAFDPLRSDPRFADLLRRMNLQPSSI